MVVMDKKGGEWLGTWNCFFVSEPPNPSPPATSTRSIAHCIDVACRTFFKSLISARPYSFTLTQRMSMPSNLTPTVMAVPRSSSELAGSSLASGRSIRRRRPSYMCLADSWGNN